MSDYKYLPQYKTVIDEKNFIVYKLSDFKKKYLQKIKEENDYQKSMDEQIIEGKQTFPFKLSDMMLAWFEACREASEERIRNYKRILNRCVVITNTKDGMDLARAKEVPISNFIKFNRASFANCIWHTEKSPSMKYYPKDNHIHCFGCGQSGDVIDVVVKMNNVSLPEAIKICLNTH